MRSATLIKLRRVKYLMDEKHLHVQRAMDALQAAKLLGSKGLVADAFSRAYYALLHASFAMLLGIGQSLPKTHSGLVAKLFASMDDLRLSRPELKRISRFQALRESGDYASLPAVDKEDLDELIGFVEKLLSRFRSE